MCVQIAGRKNLRFYSPEAALNMSIFTEYISVEVYNQTPKNKLEKYLISGGSIRILNLVLCVCTDTKFSYLDRPPDNMSALVSGSQKIDLVNRKTCDPAVRSITGEFTPSNN